MGIANKKQALGGGKTKEEKKDGSTFGGKEYLEAGIFKYKLRNPKLFSTTGLGGEKIRNLREKLLKGSDSYIKKSDLKEIRRQLDLGKLGKFRNISEREREKAKRLIDKGILKK